MSALLEAAQLAKLAAEGKVDDKKEDSKEDKKEDKKEGSKEGKKCPKCGKEDCECSKKEAAASDPQASNAVDALSRAQAAKIMGTGGALTGAAFGAIRNAKAGPAGIATAALMGGLTGAAVGSVNGALFGKGVKGSKPEEVATNMGKRFGNISGVLGAGTGAIGGAIAGASTKGVPGAVIGGLAGGLGLGGVGYLTGRLNGWTDATAGQMALGKKKEASEQMYSNDEIQMAKVAAEEVYNAAINEAAEKIAFAQALFNEAHIAGQAAEKIAAAQKVAQDNGPALGVPYIDQVKTPAGAAAFGAGAGVGGVLGYLKNPNAAGAVGGSVLGAGVVAGAGALKAFIDQHRIARAQQHAAELGNLPQAGQ